MAAGTAYPRPEGMPFPKTWARFQGQKPMKDGRVPEFWIQDVPDDMLGAILDLMCTEFIADSTFSRASRILEDPVSLEESRANWRRHLESRLSLVALTSKEYGVPVIAGCNLLIVVNKDDPSPMQGRGRARRAIDGALDAQEREAAVLERYGQERGLYASGLLVRRAFRGQGVGQQLLRVRDPLCRALGLRLTYTVFSGGAAQTLATRAGFKVVHEQRYDEYRDEEGNAVLASAEHPSFMLMAKEIPPEAEPAPGPVPTPSD